MEKKNIYFDNAATTPLDKEVLQAMLPYLEENFGNPSSIHTHGRKTRTAIERARKDIADMLNTSPAEIFFTSGGTEADNTALCSSIKTHKIKHVISSPLEHHAVLHTLKELEKNEEITLQLLEIDTLGNIKLDQLSKILKKTPNTLVSLMHANNEIGNIYNIQTIAEICKEHKAVFHSDTVQTIGHYDFDLQKCPVDCITGSAHKFHGPKGIGFLYISNNHKIHPFIYGGTQERNMRGGTENVYGIIGLAKALEIAHRDKTKDQTHILDLKKRMIKKLKETIPEIAFNGLSATLDKSLYTVLNVSLPPSDENDMLLFNLDINGISASGGSACSSGSQTGSHVIKALNLDKKRAAIRFSFSKYNTQEEIDYTVEKLGELYKLKV